MSSSDSFFSGKNRDWFMSDNGSPSRERSAPRDRCADGAAARDAAISADQFHFPAPGELPPPRPCGLDVNASLRRGALLAAVRCGECGPDRGGDCLVCGDFPAEPAVEAVPERRLSVTTAVAEARRAREASVAAISPKHDGCARCTAPECPAGVCWCLSCSELRNARFGDYELLRRLGEVRNELRAGEAAGTPAAREQPVCDARAPASSSGGARSRRWASGVPSPSAASRCDSGVARLLSFGEGFAAIVTDAGTAKCIMSSLRELELTCATAKPAIADALRTAVPAVARRVVLASPAREDDEVPRTAPPRGARGDESPCVRARADEHLFLLSEGPPATLLRQGAHDAACSAGAHDAGAHDAGGLDVGGECGKRGTSGEAPTRECSAEVAGDETSEVMRATAASFVAEAARCVRQRHAANRRGEKQRATVCCRASDDSSSPSSLACTGKHELAGEGLAAGDPAADRCRAGGAASHAAADSRDGGQSAGEWQPAAVHSSGKPWHPVDGQMNRLAGTSWDLAAGAGHFFDSVGGVGWGPAEQGWDAAAGWGTAFAHGPHAVDGTHQWPNGGGSQRHQPQGHEQSDPRHQQHHGQRLEEPHEQAQPQCRRGAGHHLEAHREQRHTAGVSTHTTSARQPELRSAAEPRGSAAVSSSWKGGVDWSRCTAEHARSILPGGGSNNNGGNRWVAQRSGECKLLSAAEVRSRQVAVVATKHRKPKPPSVHACHANRSALFQDLPPASLGHQLLTRVLAALQKVEAEGRRMSIDELGTVDAINAMWRARGRVPLWQLLNETLGDRLIQDLCPQNGLWMVTVTSVDGPFKTQRAK